MKNYLKQVYFFYTNIFKTVVSLLSVLFFSSFGCNKKIKQCKAKYKKFNECVILGNGPSLTSLLENDIDKIFDKDIFAVNFFCSTKYFEIVKPSFYVLLDKDLFENLATESLKIQIDGMITKLNSVSWEMILFIPSRYKNSLFIKNVKNKNLIITHFNYTPIDGVRSVENYLFNKNLGMPIPETVINATIFLAINMKFRTIHLYGVEQSWLRYLCVNDQNQVSVGLPHFYSSTDKTDENRSLSEFLSSQARVFKSHMRLQEYSKYQENCILNHTQGSYIDAYERKIN